MSGTGYDHASDHRWQPDRNDAAMVRWGRTCGRNKDARSQATPSDEFLYDNSGNRVLQRISNDTDSPTDTISFDGYTEQHVNWRFYGNFDEDAGHIIFDEFGKALH